MKILRSSVAFQDEQGHLLTNGSLILTLPEGVYLIVAGGGQVVGQSVIINLDATGKVPGTPQVWASDEISPQTPYTVTICSLPNGVGQVATATWLLVGSSPIDLSTLVSTTAGTPSLPGPVLLNPAGNQIITSGNLTLSAGGLTASGTGSFGGALSATTGSFAGTGTGAGTSVALEVSGNSSSTGGIQVFKGLVGISALELFRAEPSDGTVRVANLHVQGLTSGTFNGTDVASISASGAASFTSLAVSGVLTAGTFTPSSITTPVLTAGNLSGLIFVDGTKYALSAAGIQSAINDCPSGGTVMIVGQNVPLNGAGTELILINKPMKLIGGGWGGVIGGVSVLTVNAAVGSTVDVIHIKGATGIEGVEIAGLQIVAASGTPARHVLNIDATSFPVSKVYVHDNFFGALGGRAILINNPTPLTDGVFTTTIERNVLQKGINMVNAGDSIIVKSNIMPGAGAGIDGSFISGAGTFTFQDNNVTSTVAGMHITSSITVANITNNVFEGSGGSVSGSNGAYIDFDGAVGSLLNRVQFSGNRVSPIIAGIVGLRINRVDGITVENNRIDRTAGAASISITANAVGPNVTIGNNYYSPTNDLITSVISDATGLANTIAFPPMSTSANGGISSGIDFYKPIGFVNGLVVGAGQGILSAAGGGAFIVPSIATPGNLVGTTAVQTLTNKLLQSSDGTSSGPAYSFASENNSGWFRQQAGILGFSIGAVYLEQFSATLFNHAPAVTYGWAPGAPNSNAADVTIGRKQANILQIGNGAANNSGGLALNNIILGTDSAFTAGPRMLWTTYINGPIPGLTAHSAFTPDKAWTLIRIDVNWQVATANCTVAPTITITDGTTPSSMSITNATVYQTATFNQNYAGGTKLQVNLTAGTCTTAPNSSMVTFQFKSQ